jgi:mono/diheme cytochrome c family protein
MKPAAHRAPVAIGALILGTVLCVATQIQAQQLGDSAVGHKLAAEWCGSCHLIGPDIRRGAVDLAPPFAEVAGDPRTTEFRLRAFLMTPHQRMPDFRLSREQTDDVIAYILSLRRP